MKHVLISGGTRGLGLNICKKLLSSGFKLSTFGRKKTTEISQLLCESEGNLFFEECDQSQPDELNTFVNNAHEASGPIYALINNAAIAQEGILATLPEATIEKMLDINLKGTIFLTRHFYRKYLSDNLKDGRIINISSIIGTRGYNGLSVYSATKGALDAFTRSLARETGRRGICVNSISPGYMKTEMSSSLENAQMSQIIRRTPRGTLADLNDISSLAKYLLTDEASMITGQNILVDGGISC